MAGWSPTLPGWVYALMCAAFAAWAVQMMMKGY